MELAVGQSEGVMVVLVVMGEGAVALGHVEAEDGKGHGADQLLLEGTLLLMGQRVGALAGKQVVLVLVELFLDFSAEHL